MDIEEIKQLIAVDKLEEAENELTRLLEQEESEAAYLLRAGIYRKKEQFGDALNDYLSAEEINPAGVARQYIDQINEILDFYNTEMYNV